MHFNKIYCCGNKNKYTVISSTWYNSRLYKERKRVIAVNLTCKRRLLSVYRIPKIEPTKCL